MKSKVNEDNTSYIIVFIKITYCKYEELNQLPSSFLDFRVDRLQETNQLNIALRSTDYAEVHSYRLLLLMNIKTS